MPHSKPECEKTKTFLSYFLENSKHVPNFTFCYNFLQLLLQFVTTFYNFLENNFEKVYFSRTLLQAEYNAKYNAQLTTNTKIDEQQKLLLSLKSGVKKIFESTGCSMAEIDRRLGDQSEAE